MSTMVRVGHRAVEREAVVGVGRIDPLRVPGGDDHLGQRGGEGVGEMAVVGVDVTERVGDDDLGPGGQQQFAQCRLGGLVELAQHRAQDGGAGGGFAVAHGAWVVGERA